MDITQTGGEQAILNEAMEARQNGATIFVVRIVVPWREDHGVSVAMPTVAGQIEAIEKVGWRLELFGEFCRPTLALTGRAPTACSVGVSSEERVVPGGGVARRAARQAPLAGRRRSPALDHLRARGAVRGMGARSYLRYPRAAQLAIPPWEGKAATGTFSLVGTVFEPNRAHLRMDLAQGRATAFA